MPKFKIRHITRYTYQDMVRDSANQIMLYPVQDAYQDVVQHQITISGSPVVDIHEDYYHNKVGTFTHASPHRELTIDSNLIVVTLLRALPDDAPENEVQWQQLAALKHDIAFIDFLKHEAFSALYDVEKLIEDERCQRCSPLRTAQHLSQYIYDTFTYRKGITTVETTLDEIWTLRSGVCQDFAHMLLAMLRLAQIPARYVSGYICPNKNGMRGEGATHAWVEAHIPGYGWVGLDPTNNCMVNENHVRLAVGKNFSDCSPVKGTYRGTSDHTLDVTVSVSYEDGKASMGEDEHLHAEPITSVHRNSFRRHLEMQMEQQQQ